MEIPSSGGVTIYPTHKVIKKKKSSNTDEVPWDLQNLLNTEVFQSSLKPQVFCEWAAPARQPHGPAYQDNTWNCRGRLKGRHTKHISDVQAFLQLDSCGGEQALQPEEALHNRVWSCATVVTVPFPFSVPVLLFSIQGPILLSAHRATFLYPYSSLLPLTRHPVLVPGLSLDSPGEEVLCQSRWRRRGRGNKRHGQERYFPAVATCWQQRSLSFLQPRGEAGQNENQQNKQVPAEPPRQRTLFRIRVSQPIRGSFELQADPLHLPTEQLSPPLFVPHLERCLLSW